MSPGPRNWPGALETRPRTAPDRRRFGANTTRKDRAPDETGNSQVHENRSPSVEAHLAVASGISIGAPELRCRVDIESRIGAWRPRRFEERARWCGREIRTMT